MDLKFAPRSPIKRGELEARRSSGELPGRAIVALGTNLPFLGLSGPALIAAAIAALEEAGLIVLARSSPWASRAWPPSDQPDFANAVIAVGPGGRSPQALLTLLFEVETRFGRKRAGEARWAARTLDLDLIDYGGAVVDKPGLILPHPRAHQRAFVLAPLAEAAPGWRHPVLEKTAAELLAALPADGEGLRKLT